MRVSLQTDYYIILNGEKVYLSINNLYLILRQIAIADAKSLIENRFDNYYEVIKCLGDDKLSAIGEVLAASTGEQEDATLERFGVFDLSKKLYAQEG